MLPPAMSRNRIRLFYSADIHGSDRAFRKWLNAVTVYKADVIVFGGDIAGKVLVPIVRYSSDRFVAEVFGETIEVSDGEPLAQLRAKIRAAGRYDVVMTPEEKAHYDANPAAVRDDLFPRAAFESLRSWIQLAEERLSQLGVTAFVMLGNDDYPELASLLDGEFVKNVDEAVVELPGGFEMISLGYSNPTPWKTFRELPEEEILVRIRVMAERTHDPDRVVFNIHCPPHGTNLDQAALLDADLRPLLQRGQVTIGPVGSTAVRDSIREYQPLLTLHGHIHESPGIHRIRRTLAINPGSDYADGILRGALITLDPKKGVRSWQLVQG